jgi:hypothetical protein
MGHSLMPAAVPQLGASYRAVQLVYNAFIFHPDTA